MTACRAELAQAIGNIVLVYRPHQDRRVDTG